MKQCPECNEEKTDEEFYKTKRSCKECVKKRKKREYHADPETARLSARALYESSPKEAERRIKNFMKRYMKDE